MNSVINYIGNKVNVLKQNKLYKNYLNGNEQLLYVLVGIIVVYLLFYLLSGLYSLPLIILVGAFLGITIQKRYESMNESST